MTIQISNEDRQMMNRCFTKDALGNIRLVRGWEADRDDLEAAGLIDGDEPSQFTIDVLLGRVEAAE